LGNPLAQTLPQFLLHSFLCPGIHGKCLGISLIQNCTNNDVKALANNVITNFYIRVPILFPEWFMSLELPYWAVAIFTTIVGYALVSDNLAMGFILANRFTAIIRPITHEHVLQ
jgi:hypothetical protein